jgi:hypothetical protein
LSDVDVSGRERKGVEEGQHWIESMPFNKGLFDPRLDLVWFG